MSAYAGEVFRRRNRRTGTLVVLVDRERGGDWIDGDNRWQLVCDEHGTILDCESRQYATWMAPAVDEWCESCRDGLEALRNL